MQPSTSNEWSQAGDIFFSHRGRIHIFSLSKKKQPESQPLNDFGAVCDSGCKNYAGIFSPNVCTGIFNISANFLVPRLVLIIIMISNIWTLLVKFPFCALRDVISVCMRKQ